MHARGDCPASTCLPPLPHHPLLMPPPHTLPAAGSLRPVSLRQGFVDRIGAGMFLMLLYCGLRCCPPPMRALRCRCRQPCPACTSRWRSPPYLAQGAATASAWRPRGTSWVMPSRCGKLPIAQHPPGRQLHCLPRCAVLRQVRTNCHDSLRLCARCFFRRTLTGLRLPAWTARSRRRSAPRPRWVLHGKAA